MVPLYPGNRRRLLDKNRLNKKIHNYSKDEVNNVNKLRVELLKEFIVSKDQMNLERNENYHLRRLPSGSSQGEGENKGEEIPWDPSGVVSTLTQAIDTSQPLIGSTDPIAKTSATVTFTVVTELTYEDAKEKCIADNLLLAVPLSQVDND